MANQQIFKVEAKLFESSLHLFEKKWKLLISFFHQILLAILAFFEKKFAKFANKKVRFLKSLDPN